MTAEYNAVNGRAELIGDGSGWQRMRGQFPTAPAAAKQAIYVFRIESPDVATFTETGLVWNAATYFGLKFDSNFPSTSELDHSDYDNFFGSALGQTTPPNSNFTLTYDASPNGNFWLGNIIGGDPSPQFYDANGVSEELDDANNDDFPFTIESPVDGTTTVIWRIYSHPTTNEVLFECWLSRASFDLTTFDIANDMAPDNPKATFPVSSTYIKSGSIHGDTFGTNWRPNDGVMAFPAYFMACHPSLTAEWDISYVGVQYSLSVT